MNHSGEGEIRDESTKERGREGRKKRKRRYKRNRGGEWFPFSSTPSKSETQFSSVASTAKKGK